MNLLDTFFPSLSCLVCKREIINIACPYLCAECFSRLPLHKHACAKCGRSIQENAFVCERCKYALSANGVLAKSRTKKWNYLDRAYSAFTYDGIIIDLLLGLKYNAVGDVARFVAPYLAEIIEKHNIKFDALIPIPLARRREKERGYNQSKVIATELLNELKEKHSYATKPKLLDNVLIRVCETKAQKKMTQKERQENVRDAFGITDATPIKGKRILLIDDVLTTGATSNECARMLEQAKAASVELLTVASTSDMK